MAALAAHGMAALAAGRIAAMAAAVVLLKWALNSRGVLGFRFSLEVLAGASTYIFVMLAFHRSRIALFWGIIIAGLRN